MKLDFKKNLGSIDKIIRTVLGLVSIWLAYNKIITGWIANLVITFGLLQFIEAYLGY
ncbi:YgaP-like transmembrane domain [Tepidibacter mesophilus]|uniref:YgaP-like transmembrane domain n=1 Tax=Tepidibacter mesophilus TaxID=655607 RepID=UPI00165163FF|nr:YgaP-like transmembrane domain [Tepidibacter mesophilus]